MGKEHHVVYIPGLGDQEFLGRQFNRMILPLFWDARGFPLHVVAPDWYRGQSFVPKLQLILRKVDELLAEGKRVSIIGQSAGGSAALNVFSVRREAVTAAINSTGRLRQGHLVGLPTFEQASKYSTAFRQSVLMFETDFEATLTTEDRGRIMTVRPKWDQVVPPLTVSLEGATNLEPRLAIGHTLGGAYIMTFHSHVLQRFLRNI